MTTLLGRGPRVRPEPNEMTLSEHLGELRRRLVICAVVFAAAAIATYVLYNQILNLMLQPFCEINHGHCSLVAFGPIQGFAARLNVSAYGGLIFASPVILWELWRFVTPGLRTHERRYAISFVLAGVVFFCIGGFIAWETLPHTLGFLKSAAGNKVSPLYTPQSYLSLVMALFVIFGITFEFPVVLVGLELGGAITPAMLRKSRRIAIIAITVFSGVITPSSDPFSMLALAVPLLVFYEGSILVGRLFGK
jgi:sec-independent protein translocase protein TatC